MSKLYEITVDGTRYRIISSNVGSATKKAIVVHFDGREEPKAISLTVTAREIPAIEKI